ncbi:VOC family protein [Pseudoduganella sp. RAF19]|jgi:glyoxylase I family protein|uniref:VOC family protein n=1 Tax=Pseudoduganella sp. RAF19 TaxID=3233052 RepID=UPI003F9BBDD5
MPDILLDHLILNVRDAAASARFYQDILGFRHEGRAGPFEIVRVNAGLTLDLMQSEPALQQHLAFALAREDFEQVHQRLKATGIAFGGNHFERNGGPPGRTLGARGMADSIYFDDPDHHSIEIRCYG